MYHFVKFNKTWYLKPETIHDISDHFLKICSREFREGFEDFINNTVVIKNPTDGSSMLYSKNHSSSVWRNAVELGIHLKGDSWLNIANSLEERTFADRINLFKKGRAIYLTDGLPYYCAMEHPTYDEEVWKEELEYPYEYQYENVRFIQWKDGRHWYAKIGSIDITDRHGNQKWSDKSYAQKVAKDWCKCGGDWELIEY